MLGMSSLATMYLSLRPKSQFDFHVQSGTYNARKTVTWQIFSPPLDYLLTKAGVTEFTTKAVSAGACHRCPQNMRNCWRKGPPTRWVTDGGLIFCFCLLKSRVDSSVGSGSMCRRRARAVTASGWCRYASGSAAPSCKRIDWSTCVADIERITDTVFDKRPLKAPARHVRQRATDAVIQPIKAIVAEKDIYATCPTINVA